MERFDGERALEPAADGDSVLAQGKAGGAARVCGGELGTVCAARRDVCAMGNKNGLRVSECCGESVGWR